MLPKIDIAGAAAELTKSINALKLYTSLKPLGIKLKPPLIKKTAFLKLVSQEPIKVFAILMLRMIYYWPHTQISKWDYIIFRIFVLN